MQVIGSAKSKQMAFLENKGLTAEEITQALARVVSITGTSPSIPTFQAYPTAASKQEVQVPVVPPRSIKEIVATGIIVVGVWATAKTLIISRNPISNPL